MATPYQVSKFEPMRIYDAPAVWVDSLFEGEISTRGVVNALFNPDTLTASERTTYIDQLKEVAGGGIAGDILGMAANPAVWLAFAFRPGAANALKSGSRLFPRTARRNFLLSWVHNGGELYRNTPMDAVAQGLLHGVNAVHTNTFAPILEHAEARLVAKLGYDPRKMRLSDVAKKSPDIERLMWSIFADVSGMSRGAARTTREVVPTVSLLEDGLPPARVTDNDTVLMIYDEWRNRLATGNTQPIRLHRNALGQTSLADDGSIEVVVGRPDRGQLQVVDRTEIEDLRFGRDEMVRDLPEAQALADAYHNATQLRMLQLTAREDVVEAFSREAVKPGAPRLRAQDVVGGDPKSWVDPKKIGGLYRLAQHSRLGAKDSVDSWGYLDMLMGPTVREAVSEGWLDQDQWLELVTDSVGSRIREEVFVPRSMPGAYTINTRNTAAGPVRIADSDVYRGRADLGLSGMTVSAIKQRTSVWGPVTLDRIEELFPEAHGPVSVARKRFRGGMLESFAEGQARWAHDIDPIEIFHRYGRQTAADYALAVAPTKSDRLLKLMQKEALEATTSYGAHHTTEGRHRGVVFADQTDGPSGDWTYLDAIDQVSDLTGDSKLNDYLFNLFLPALLGRKPQGIMVAEGAVKLAQRSISNALNGAFGEALSSTSWGQAVRLRMQQWVDADPADLARTGVNEASSYLYSTHIGANPGTVILQMTQPWLHLANTVGMKEVGAAQFMDAPKEMLKYFQLRSKLGMRITSEERQALYKEAFEYPELLGIHGHILESLDEIALKRHADHGGWFKFWTQDAPMTPFAWAEIWNRLTTIHAVRRRYAAAGIDISNRDSDSYVKFAADTMNAQRDTQFSTGVMDTPLFLQKAPFNNPLLRMLMSFAVRAPTAFVTLGRGVAGGKRSDILGISDKWPWYVADTLRMAGISSIVYELGKMAGGDLSPGLAGDSLLSIMSDRQSVYEGGVKTLPLNVPPPVSLAVNLALGSLHAIGGDTSLLRENLMRAVPAGVGLSKMATSLPKLPVPLNLLQKRYADWHNPLPTGEVPIMSWDGRLIEYKKGSEIVYAGLGVDLGAHKKTGEIDGWLARQREEIINYRQRYLMALTGNNLPKANAIANEYGKRFQLPLTVSKQQLRAFIKQRNVPRTERMLDTFPSDVRPQVRQMLSDSYKRMGMDQQTWLEQETSTRRSALLGRKDVPSIDPGVMEGLDALVQEHNRLHSERTFQ